MIKKIILSVMLAIPMIASAHMTPVDSLQEVSVNNAYLQRLTPAETKDFVKLGKFSQHWFLGVQGGASAFIGSPVGCGDIFDRVTPTYNAYLGKWFTPGVGMRIAFQGQKFFDSELKKHDFQLYHADLMYNMADLFRSPSEKLPRWDFIPYVGMGLVHTNAENSSCVCVAPYNHFALTYGIQGRYRFARNWHLTAELGGFTTFKNFDLNGSAKAFGDNMLSASLGVAVTLGNPRWKHAVDANPYINQNDYLLSYVERLESSNRALRNQHNIDFKTLEELKKILEIEGLLDKYGYLFDDGSKGKNNYKGLLALKNRIKGMQGTVSTSDIGESYESINSNILNVPIYFFFKLGKAELTDNSQLINLDELAKVAQNHNLKIRIEGAADSATGSASMNNELSMNRARFIAKQLKQRGIATENMKGVSRGGVNEFSNPKDNRYTKVSVYLEMDGEGMK